MSELCRLSCSTLRRWADKNKLKCSRDPQNNRLFLLKDFQQYIVDNNIIGYCPMLKTSSECYNKHYTYLKTIPIHTIVGTIDELVIAFETINYNKLIYTNLTSFSDMKLIHHQCDRYTITYEKIIYDVSELSMIDMYSDLIEHLGYLTANNLLKTPIKKEIMHMLKQKNPA